MARKSLSPRRNKVRLSNLVVGSFVLFSLSSYSYAQETLVDGSRAVVNGKPVLHSTVEEKVKTGPLVSVSDYPSVGGATNAERALNDAINFQIILEAAEENDIDISDEEVDAEIDRFIKAQNTTRKQLDQFLAKQNKSYEDYRKDFSKQLLLQQFQRQVILPRVKVTDKDVEAFYQSKGGVVDPSQVTMTLQQIIVGPDPQRASDLYEKVKGTKNFSAAVEKYSEGPKGEGAFLRNLRLAELAPNIQEALVKLGKGEISLPVQSQAGFHLFYVVSRSESKLADDDYVKLKPRLENELRNKKLLEQTNSWLVEAREGARVTVSGKK